MLVLDATTKSIVATMSGAATTTNPSFVTAYSDNTGSVFTEGSSDGALNGTNSVTLVAAPASSTRRLVKTIYISNIDTAAVTLTISYNDNATLRQIVKVTLQVGDTWSTDGTTDNSGSLKTTVGSVNLSSVTNTLAVANGGTGLTSFTANGVVYASSTSALATGSSLVWTGSALGIGTSSPLDKLDAVSASSTYRNRIRNSGANEATLLFQNSSTGTATNDGLYLGIVGSMDAYLWNYENNPIIFGTNNTERMRINATAPILCLSGGNTTATGTGIAFPATQSASSDANTLDDYEEGTYTPSFGGGNSNPTVSYSNQIGYYTKVGNVVYFTSWVYWNSFSGGSGNLQVGGLPFTNKAGGESYPSMSVWFTSMNWTGESVTGLIVSGSTYFWITGLNKGSAYTPIQCSQVNGTGEVRCSGFYTIS